VQPRTAKQRQEILALLRADGTFRTTQQIHAGLNAAGHRVGLATVYRNLAALAQSGAVDCIVHDNGETRYRRCSPEHHHHLLCRDCGRTVEVQAATFEAWCNKTAQTHGFRDIEHTVEIVGTCRDCG
jgi:Fur family ferric uptake transcriptional regulator